jgi:hypothetical protein
MKVMSYETWKQNRQKHLAQWIREPECKEPGLKNGIFNYRGTVKGYGHILPLEGPGKKAIITAINQYKVLTDGVTLDTSVLELKHIHRFAHHLTSSQMLCYNYFMLMTAKDAENTLQPTASLIQLLGEWGISISDKAICKFEYVDNKEEGTNFDFHILDNGSGVEIFFEIKYTENGFGAAPQDDEHKEKFCKIYTPWLDSQFACNKNVSETNFLKHYQLYRNVIRVTDKNKYVVFIIPEGNERCKKQLEAFTAKLKDKGNVKCLYWEDILDKQTELYQKYFG